MKHRFALHFMLVFLVITLLTGCDDGAVPTPTPIPGESVAPQLLPLYQQISAVIPKGLGEAIKPAEEENGQIRQVFEDGVMRYDVASQRVFLEPIGYQQISTPEAPSEPQGPTWQNIQGYWVPSIIANTYNQIGGETVVGKPLSNYNYNFQRQRYEIYFENLGMYILDGDPSAQVHLLPYGQWLTAMTNSNVDASVDKAIIRNAAEAFDTVAKRLTPEYTGNIITPLIIDSQKRILRVYENIIMVWNPEQNNITWLNAPEALGIQRKPLTTQIDDARLTFAPDPTNPSLGHNIPILFWDFIRTHSGLEVSGTPIMELEEKPDTQGDIWWQCFEHICMEYNPNTNKVQMTPVGKLYYERFLRQIPRRDTAPPLSTEIQIFQESRQVSPGDTQQVMVNVTTQGESPANISLKLNIHLPDGRVNVLWFPPTDATGQSSLTLPPIQAENNTPIRYEVCTADEMVCVSEQFVIWGNP